MMRCVAVLGSGAQCSREAAGEDGLCPRHRSVAFRRGVRAFQLARVAAEDKEALAAAAELSGLDAEMTVLRVLIRRAVGSRDVDVARRGIESLRRAVETRGRLEALLTGAGRGARNAEGGAAKARLDALFEGLGGQGPQPEGEAGGRFPRTLVSGLRDSDPCGSRPHPHPLAEGPEGEGTDASLPEAEGTDASPSGKEPALSLWRGRRSPRKRASRVVAAPSMARGADSARRTSQAMGEEGGARGSDAWLEEEAAELVLRHQAGEPEALGLIYSLLEVAIVGVALNERALQPPAAMTLEELREESRSVLDELARRWRPGVGFLGYFFRTFPSAMARYARRGQRSKGERPRPEGRGRPPEGTRTPGTGGALTRPARSRPDFVGGLSQGESRIAAVPSPSGSQGERHRWSEGPYSAEDLASLPEVERQIVVLSALEGHSMRGIARRVGVPEMAAYKLYQQARQRLEGRVRSLEGGELLSLRRLVEAVHAAAGPEGRLPGRGWTMAAAGLKQLEYNQLIGRLEAAGAIEGRGLRQPGRLVERDPAATLARLGIG